MESNNTGLFLLGVTLAAGLVGASTIGARTAERIKFANEGISVKGTAEQQVRADVAVWRGRIIVRAADLSGAYFQLDLARKRFAEFLAAQQIPAEKVEMGSVMTNTQYRLDTNGVATSDVSGYSLEQPILYTANDVQQVAKLSQEAADLLRRGVEFNANEPEYYVSNIDQVKISLLGKATQNAKARADQFAQASGVNVGALKSASQGVFQITPVNSTDTSDYGTYDTRTIDKAARVVVTVEYAIER